MARLPRIAIMLAWIAIAHSAAAGPLPAPQSSAPSLLTRGTATQQPHAGPVPGAVRHAQTVGSDRQTLPPQAESLDDAWATAVEKDMTLQAMRLRKAARDLEFAAAKSQRWPNAAVDGFYSWRSDDLSLQFPSTILPPAGAQVPFLPEDQSLVRGYLDLPLYTGHRISSNMAAAAARSDAQYHRLLQSQRDLKLRVLEEYVAVLRAQYEVTAANSQVQNLTAQVRDTHVMVETGQASRQDVLSAETALSDAEHQAIMAKHALDLAKAVYNRRMGRPLTAQVTLQALQVPELRLDLEPLVRRAVAQNAVSRELRAVSQALRSEAEALRSSTRPQVHVFGGYTYAENPYQAPDGRAEAALGVSWNVFDAGGRRRQAKAKELYATATSLDVAEAQATIEIEVRQAWLNVQAARQRLEAASKGLQLAEEALRASRVRQASGFANSSAVLDGESQRVSAIRNYVNAHCDAVLAHARLMHIVGDL